MQLPADRRTGNVVQNVGRLELMPLGRVQRERGPVLANHHRVGNGPDGPPCRLEDDAGLPKEVDKALGGTVQAWRLRGVEFNNVVIDTKPGQGGKDVLDETNLERG